ncbi:uncharacterized protein LOC141854253 [Brevipalpus obovatus]|uniref:uncharacterized protein LOC141854253 n=1 Tax=Brevipalpus obovatus TaxID=246614 RepID=UPI003D9F77CA
MSTEIRLAKNIVDHQEAVKDTKPRKKKDLRREVSKSKQAKYTSASLSVRQALKDVKNTASKHISNIKNTFDSVSQKLRITSPKDGPKRCVGEGNVLYDEFENEPKTPIKLYSPFGIETPSASNRAKIVVQKNRKPKPLHVKIHQPLVFQSPTGKMKEDVRSLTNSLTELSLMSNSIKVKCLAKKMENQSANNQPTIDELLQM